MIVVNRFEDLIVWQKARLCCQKIFVITSSGEFAKDFTLKDQINRSAGSVMDNIAEGFGRKGKKEFIQFLFIAKGSAIETKSQLYRAKDRCYITENCMRELFELLDQVLKMIYSLVKKLQFKLNN